MGIKTVEDILSHLAIIIAGIGSVVLAIRTIIKPPKSKDASPPIIQGQSVPVEEPWATDMRESNKRTRKRLEKALTRLAANGIEYEDI